MPPIVPPFLLGALACRAGRISVSRRKQGSFYSIDPNAREKNGAPICVGGTSGGTTETKLTNWFCFSEVIAVLLAHALFIETCGGTTQQVRWYWQARLGVWVYQDAASFNFFGTKRSIENVVRVVVRNCSPPLRGPRCWDQQFITQLVKLHQNGLLHFHCCFEL
jgi:hypothetical protein